MAIALLSVIGLLSFVGLMVVNSENKAELLKDIQTHRYPVQSQLLSALHTLEFIHRELEIAIITGDEDAIAATHSLTSELHATLNNVQSLNQTYRGEISRLLKLFDEYYQDATRLAYEFINPFNLDASLARQGRENAAQYQSLMSSLNKFQNARHLDFTQSISQTTKKARETVSLAITSGIIVVALVLTLALLTANGIIRRIREMVDTLKRIATVDGDMNARIRITGRDEMSELAHWFNSFIHKLNETTQQATRDVWHIANTDALSGLPNRRYLTEWIQTQGETSTATHCEYSVFFLDLDNFKPINDQLGHEAGDELISQAAARLQKVVNRRDLSKDSRLLQLATDRGIVGRLGGDEFMVILPDLSEQELVENISRQLLEEVTKPYTVAGVKCHIGVSIGICRFPIDATDKNTVLNKADKAMYEAKAAGKNRYIFYNQKMDKEIAFTNDLQRSLKSSSVTDEFHLVYQPRVNLGTGEMNGAEALLRWNSPTLGEVSPGVFIPFAEQHKLIRKIDQWVIRNVCLQLGIWQAAGLISGYLSLNVSAQSMQENWLPALVATEIKRNRVTASTLEIEITESSVIEINDDLMRNVTALRKTGVRLAMDDFGAGHSSLRLLMNNKIDVLKIDKGLIDDINLDNRRQQIVQSILAMCNALSVITVAEGIEHSNQLDCLKDLGCIEGQGNLIARPLELQDFEDSYLRTELPKVVGQ